MLRMLMVAVFIGCGTPPPTTPAPIANPEPVRMKDDVSDLLARLDQVGGSFSSFETDALLVEIRARGEAAVDPLIAILESDERTSQAEFDREHEFEKPTKVPVYRIAYWLLGKLIATAYFESPYLPEMTMAREGLAGRKKVAGEIRAHWKTWRGVPIAERWFRILADDKSPDNEAVDAATKILQFVETTHFYDPSDVTKQVPLAGEALRAHAKPSVSDLLVARIPRLPLAEGCELARLLGRWDRAAAKPIAASQMTRAIDASKGTVAEGHCIRALTIVRVALGDLAALDEYAAWIGGVAPPTDMWEAAVFEPMWKHPDHPAIGKAADQLFGAKSRWLPLIPSDKTHAPRMAVIGLPLYKVPAFQRMAIAALADRRVVGECTTALDRSWHYAVNGAGSTSTTARDDDTTFPSTIVRNPIRVADYWAYEIAKTDGAPRFEMYWPLAQRDSVIAQTTTWVRH